MWDKKQRRASAGSELDDSRRFWRSDLIATAVIVVAAHGGWVVLGISLGAIAAWMIVRKLFLHIT